MSSALLIIIAGSVVATSFLSGIFGMAGGLVLIGILFALLPVPEAMTLHAITQMSSNGWRGMLWVRYVRWRSVAAYFAGCLVAFGAWSIWLYVPSKPVALLLLGVTPFLARLLPEGLSPNPERISHGIVFGAISMTLLLLTGVAGPLLDTFFLGGTLTRREIIATKAVGQIFGHGLKFAYFGGLVTEAAGVDPLMAGVAIAATLIGTSAARPVLERLTDAQYRLWAARIITAIGLYYIGQGTWLLIAGGGW
jgi:uncharacterized membrane protein YfcA